MRINSALIPQPVSLTVMTTRPPAKAVAKAAPAKPAPKPAPVKAENKDVINRCGEKIAAAEVESCLLQQPEVLEAAVFAVPDEETGEAIAAVVSVREGSGLDAQALRAHVGAHLAAYKVPAVVHVLTDALPRNPAGKLVGLGESIGDPLAIATVRETLAR